MASNTITYKYQQFTKHILAVSVTAICLFISGCAEIPKEMRYGIEGMTPGQLKHWPAAPEVPRFVFAGQLIGEPNFVPKKGHDTSVLTKFLKAVAGVEDEADPSLLFRPQSGVVDLNNRVYVTDIGHAAVYVFDAVAGKLLIWDLATDNTRFISPVGIALDNNNHLLVADADLGIVVRLDPTGKPVGNFGKGTLNRPTGLARDPIRGLIYVTDTHDHNIKIFNDHGELIEILGNRGTGLGEFNFPTHITFARDRLYITDTMNTRIQVLDASGDVIEHFGKRGTYIGNLVRPKGVAVDDEGNIYVVESYNDHLLIYSESGEFLLPISGNAADIGQLYLPSGVWIDHQNRVYVADTFNRRVVVFQFLGV